MPRLRYAILVVLWVAACTPMPTATGPSPSGTPRTSTSARLSVAGTGEVCGPWWKGCGAVFSVEPPNWRLPNDWSPSADDTVFGTDPRADSDGAVRVTGISQAGRDQIGQGAYRFVVIMTMSPDTLPATLSAALGCSADVRIPPATRTVTVDVTFDPNGSSCVINVSMDPMPVPGNT